MSDEEEDYMSDKFLTKLNDVRPSLIQDRGKKRQAELECKRQATIKQQREASGKGRNERLQESLKQAITADNKGFQLLAKMGYKPGQALGKAPTTSETANKRLTEPVGITIKEDRGGLGREAALKELNEKRRHLRQQRLREKMGTGETLSTEEFRRRANAKAQERFVAGALNGCQKTCENLDRAAGLESPEMNWFWPERSQEIAEDAEKKDESEEAEVLPDEEVEYTAAEKLEMLTNYLRTAYIFCFWCGVKYNDLDDLERNCAGLTRDEH